MENILIRKEELTKYEITINMVKTEIKVLGAKPREVQLTIDNYRLQEVDKIKYQGLIIKGGMDHKLTG